METGNYNTLKQFCRAVLKNVADFQVTALQSTSFYLYDQCHKKQFPAGIYITRGNEHQYRQAPKIKNWSNIGEFKLAFTIIFATLLIKYDRENVTALHKAWNNYKIKKE